MSPREAARPEAVEPVDDRAGAVFWAVAVAVKVMCRAAVVDVVDMSGVVSVVTV
jgi:hypothetical protein